MTETTAIRGACAPGFEALRAAFAENVATRDEGPAALCVIVDGTRVADLKTAGWKDDSLACVFSVTKAATALCLHLLAARGAAKLSDPVTRFWPEFAGDGREEITLAMLLDHSAGLPAIRAPMKPDCLTDWAYMTEHLARETPFWRPGSMTGYHAVTFGFLVGEVVRRITGQSLGAVFAEQIARPLGLDFHIGLPEAQTPRALPITPYQPTKNDREQPFLKAVLSKGTIPNLFVFNSGDWATKGVNTPAGLEAEIPAANGVADAASLATLFAALAEGGEALGLSPADIESFAQASAATHLDQTLQAPTRFGPGFMLNMGRRAGESLAIGPRAFGHVGMGGSLGFADPEARLGFGYVMTRQGGGLLLNDRGQTLVDATYRALGRA